MQPIVEQRLGIIYLKHLALKGRQNTDTQTQLKLAYQALRTRRAEPTFSIITDPDIREPKVGDLTGISVYKFRMVHQQTLLAYQYQHETITITLLTLGTHENFNRDLKKA